MAFRNRPVLDRKHRPRWQDELRTQQLIVAGFALAIAAAVGIFGAAAWSSFHETNLREAALIDGTAVRRSDMLQRVGIVAAELQSTAIDLQDHAGGARDQVVQQQLQAISAAIQNVQQSGADSLVNGLILDHRSAEVGGQPSDEEIQAELDKRRNHPARAELSLIIRVPVKAEGAKELTDADWRKAKQEIDDVKAELDAGGDFAELAKQHSADPSAAQNGLLGWITDKDAQYGKYVEASADADVGDVVGPLKSDAGWYLLQVEDREAAGPNDTLTDLLASLGISDEAYRDYVRQEVMSTQVQDYFASTIETRYQPQREVSQIVINAESGFPVPKVRIRHILVSPLPGEDDQSKATKAQWQAALAKARDIRAKAVARKDTDWFALAAGTDDSGSASRGGFLGWYDPTDLTSQFVKPFANAVADLEQGEVSEPVRSKFGYHVIQVTDERTSAEGLAQRLVAELRDDPDTFGEVAKMLSEDVGSAKKAGDIGWVIHYQFDSQRDKAIFDLAEADQISDPVVTQGGIYIYQLTARSEHRFVSQERRDALGTSGFTRWLDELKSEAGVWLDTEFASSGTAAG